jgi:hypothetical protein
MYPEKIFPDSDKDHHKNTLTDIFEMMDVNHNDTKD